MRFTTLKSKTAAAAVVAIALAGGAAAAGTAGTAQAATPSAGSSAANFTNEQIGLGSLLDDYKRSTTIGTQIILFQKSNSDPAEDFAVFEEGYVKDFFAAGLVSSAFNLHYGDNVAVELEYDPYGVGTGECVGLASAAFQREQVTLQPCGVSSKTVWATDVRDPNYLFNERNDLALANGSDTNFSFPYVLTYPDGANPVDKPRVSVDVEQITGFFGQIPNPLPSPAPSPSATLTPPPPTGPAYDNQQWEAFTGVVK